MVTKLITTVNNKTQITKKYISIALNALIFISSILGVVLACTFAVRDGYSHWHKRLLYFTQQSNIWIGVTCFIFAVLSILESVKRASIIKNYLYVLKFIFTVSITVTGLIFCTLLAPFADFDVWSFSSVLTHVVAPVLSILDLFIGQNGHILKIKHTYLALIPPSIYFVLASVLCVMRVDFGRGDAFPYFFMNYYSEAGMFGFKGGKLPELGVFYWIMFFLSLIYALSFGYYKAYNAIGKKIRTQIEHL